MMVLNGRYEQILDVLADAGLHGATAREVVRTAGISRSQASGALSNLMNRGDVIKLPMTRDGSVVYLHAGRAQDARDVLGVDASEAFDRGFALGLSEGSAGAREEAMAAGYEDGWREGQAAFAKQVGRFLDEMVRAIRAEHGMTVAMRSAKSWTIHPEHTVETVRKHLERLTGVSLGPVRTEALPDGIVDLTMVRESR